VRNPQGTRQATRLASISMIVVGIALIVFALLADVIGIGGGKGFGYQQMIVLIVGLVILLGGAAILTQPLVNNRLRD
jgi:hypothetical protein